MIRYLLFFFALIKPIYGLQIDQVVIWGHKLHSHTHSYIHYGFYKAFRYLRYKTLWLDNNDDLSNIDFKNTLFITEHQVDDHIPLREDCYYVVHNSSDPKYDYLKSKRRYVNLIVYKNIYLNAHNMKQILPFVYYDLGNHSLMFPWASDLLPHEIEKNKLKTCLHKKHRRKKHIFWIGTIGGGWAGNVNELNPFIKACRHSCVRFHQRHGIEANEAIRLIQSSYLAPAICGAIQLQHDYIPCRIFKNISYGHMGITNSKAVYELFNQKIVYHPDTYHLFFLAKDRLEHLSMEELYEMMDFVKDNHTYINRIHQIMHFIECLQNPILAEALR